MERVIKFRAWDDINKKWLLGYEYPNLRGFSMKGEIMLFGEYMKALSSFKLEEFERLMLMQYVGLNDNNFKESYVGDILKETLFNGEERLFKIFQVPGGFAINTFQDDFYKPIEQIQFWTALSDMQTISWFKSSLEIIGNIYENPELLAIDKTKTV